MGSARTSGLIASELVGNAVKATGIQEARPKGWHITAQHVIGVQLRVIDTDLYVEVYDNDTSAPVRQKPSLDAEGGRGLLLVEALSVKWDIYRPPVGGKVVWAQLAPSKLVIPSKGSNALPRGLLGASNPPDGPAKEMATIALMQRAFAAR